jgi:hypothetical protein
LEQSRIASLNSSLQRFELLRSIRDLTADLTVLLTVSKK